MYGGEICAALDRQHPLNPFDVKLRLSNDELNREIFNGFIVYLLEHNRPIPELLNPNWKDISAVYYNEFERMASDPLSLKALEVTLEKLISAVKSHFVSVSFPLESQVIKYILRRIYF